MVIPEHTRFSTGEGGEKRVNWKDYDELMEGLRGIVGAEGMQDVERVLSRGGSGSWVDFKEGR